MTFQQLSRADHTTLAYVHTPAETRGMRYPLIMFFGGYRSDMNGTKATYLEQEARKRGQGFLRFDYSGHGLSGGVFEEGSITEWKDDALAVLGHINPPAAIFVGSSMGGWIALRAALERPELVKGLVGIAAAPDFTEALYAHLDTQQKKDLERHGQVSVPNHYDAPPYTFTKKLYEDGKRNLILNDRHKFDFPVRLIQGMRDEDVPWETAVKIQNVLEAPDIDILMIQDGDHRLSRPEDLALIDREVRSISGYI